MCYGSSGPRSRPQQLLVYDGRCWSCAAAGSCVTRPLSPCFQPGQLLPVVPVLRFHFNFSGVNVVGESRLLKDGESERETVHLPWNQSCSR